MLFISQHPLTIATSNYHHNHNIYYFALSTFWPHSSVNKNLSYQSFKNFALSQMGCTPCIKQETIKTHAKEKQAISSGMTTSSQVPTLSRLLATQSLCKHIDNSKLLSQHLSNHLHSQSLLPNNASYQLLFRASEHQYSAKMFHQKCKNCSTTLLLVLSANKRVFGAFTPCKWKDSSSMYEYQSDPKNSSFIFRMLNDTIDIYKLKSEAQDKAIMNDGDLGPVYGQGHDLSIQDQCNIHESWSCLGKSYMCPYLYGSQKANQLLAGQQKYRIRQYQLWEITGHQARPQQK